MRELLKRQRQSSKLTTEQIQRKLMENGLFKDDLSKNAPVRRSISSSMIMKEYFQILFPRKRTSFSPVITRKRGLKIIFIALNVIENMLILL